MDKTVQVCVKCNTSLAIGLKLHFCPYCGTAQLEKKLLDERSTKNYDPRNPSFKPWRDRPAVPKRAYKPVDANKRPWCPAMRQPRLRPKKTATQIDYGGVDQSTLQRDAELESAGPEIQEDRAEIDEGVSEEEREDEVVEEAPAETFIGLYTETIDPVAMYDAERWMAVGGMAVNISLIEQTLGDIHRAYWLRIGVMFDDDLRRPGPASQTTVLAYSQSVALDQGDAETSHNALESPRRNENDDEVPSTPLPSALAIDTNARDAENTAGDNTTEEEGQLYTIAVLSSDVGKLMVPGADDWVELSAVDPMEYYMARHMEKVLQSIAHRVVTTNLNELALRQTYNVHVRRRTKQTKFADALSSVGGGLSLLAVERLSAMHTSTAAWGYNANQIVCQSVANASNGSPAGHMMSRTTSSISVCFQDWVVQLSHRLVLTRGISVRHYPSLVRVSFRYEDRLTDPKLFPGSGAASAPNSVAKSSSLNLEEVEQHEAEGRYVDPRVAERNKKLHYFAASQRITHAVLHITPTAVSVSGVVPPAELSFDLHSMRHLMRDNAPISFDEMVADGKKRVHSFATHLASLVRLEYTNNGVKYTVVGAFSEPPHETCGWPLDVPSFMDEDIDDLLLEEEAEKAEVVETEPEPAPEPPRFEEESANVLEKLKPPPDPEPEPVSEPEPLIVPEPEAEFPRPPTPPSPPAELLPYSEPCPIHPVLCSMTPDMCGCARTHCKCAHQLVTLKGSEIMLWADFSQLEDTPSLSNEDDAEAHASETLLLPSTVEGEMYLTCSNELKSVNKLRLVAVDQVDADLTCEVVLPAERVAELLKRACTASTTGDEDVKPAEGIMRTYKVPSSGPVLIDLMQHPALRRLCFDFICDSSMLDLFLSRKSNLMKLIVK